MAPAAAVGEATEVGPREATTAVSEMTITIMAETEARETVAVVEAEIRRKAFLIPET